MEREILFKGKRKDNEQFIQGSLSVEYDGTCFISYWENQLIESENNYQELVCKWYEVITKTIGQYTSLDDVKKVKIFSGDKIKAFDSIYEITFIDGAYFLKKGHNVFHRLSKRLIEQEQIQIIGNIHEK